MIQQVSNSELELMKIVWASGGTALYAHIMEELSKAAPHEGRRVPLRGEILRARSSDFLHVPKGEEGEYP